jgi:D-2-hydroxyacid dehydrogenase (NADP+)
MEIHTFLVDEDDRTINFSPQDLSAFDQAMPDHQFHHHATSDSLLGAAGQADYILTWKFEAHWYAKCDHLKAIITPAAGRDWVATDPSGRVTVSHGTFHGPILGESLLSAVLFMNHRMPAMIRNFQSRAWERDLQSDCRLLSEQTVLIVGLGNIGQHCARMLKPLASRIIGVRRTVATANEFECVQVEQLPDVLPLADHVVLLLPGGNATDRFLNSERLALMKPGSYVYNFGRGNAIVVADLVPALARLGGAFLDVTETEPLPADSPLWQQDNVFITPHSSCMYQDYAARFIAQVAELLSRP